MVCVSVSGGGACCGPGLPAELERIIMNFSVSRGPSHLNYK